MKTEIIKLRQIMEREKIDAWLCPSSDAHSSEYLSEYDKEREFLSGFTGSAGTLLVTKDRALLWTDGRYFVQAEKELENSGIELMKMGLAGVPTLTEFIEENMKSGEVLGFSALLLNTKSALAYEKILSEKNISIKADKDIVAEVWEDRPARSANFVFVLGTEFTGETVVNKLTRLRKKLEENRANANLITDLSDIAWLTNMRGSDIECNPQYLSYMYVSADEAILFIQSKVLTEEIKAHLEEAGIKVKDYDAYYDYIKENVKGKKLLLDNTSCNYKTYLSVKEGNELIDALSPVCLFKNVKNAVEIKMMRNSHIRDGVYETRFIKWLLESIKSGKRISETDASDYLDKLRAEDLKYLSLSFEDISAYGPNAAMPHYQATKNDCAYLEPKGLYLIDSGASYMDGTTDVTRTIALGELTKEERLHYTLVTIGMLRLMNVKFPKGTKGVCLDIMARQAMWEYGIDFNHGTGHGVGFCNGVHEGPVAIRNRPHPDARFELPFEAGMVVSDEPGIYIAGSHGIRCENLILSVELENGFLGFEPLTMIPIDASALDINIMTEKDIEYFNSYQALVYSKLEPYFEGEDREWLKDKTKAIGV